MKPLLLKPICSASSINNSVSKQKYSFGKAERFKQSLQKDVLYAFYSIPDTKSKRSSSIGYGKKCDVFQGKRELNTSNVSMPTLPTILPHNIKDPKHSSFGIGRDSNCSSRRKDISPGPIYDTSKSLGSDAPSYVFGGNSNRSISNRNILSPGPGQYQPVQINAKGSYFLSKFRNVKSINLNSKSKRFVYKADNTPGPGQYSLPSLINRNGFIFQSQFRSESPRSILGKKQIDSKKDITPGPGQYNNFSDFE